MNILLQPSVVKKKNTCPTMKLQQLAFCMTYHNLGWWSNGDLDELVRKGRAIQQRLTKNESTKVNSNLSRSFSNLMFEGKCKAALAMEGKGGILHPDDLHSRLPLQLQKAVELAKEKGASTWFTALPLKEHGFSLHKTAFHDAMALRYGWSKCDCGKNFSLEHALSCAKGGFPSIRHNDICDLTANLLTEVCSDVCIEPDLQPTTSDQMSGATANSQDGARVDASANGVWGGRYEKTFFDVQVFNPHAPSNKNRTTSACYRKHEREKKGAYEQRIREMDHSSFTPLVSPLSHRRNGERGNLFLQMPGLYICSLGSGIILAVPHSIG